jgi:RND family efflux transporter MFP subunit
MTVSPTDDRAAGAATRGGLHKSSQFRATLLADRSRHRHRRLAGLVVVLLVAAAAAIVVVARSANASPTAHYRTATASVHDVDQQITGVATIEPVAQAAVAFPTSGTVASVDVSVGATVVAGQTLATLDTRLLDVALHNEQATLANAQLALQRALNGPSTAQGGAAASDQRATPAASTGGDASTGSTVSAVTAADQYAAQQAVVAAEAEVTVAEQAIAQATIASPIAGTVEAVSLHVGDTVSGGSTTATILIVGAGGVEATTTVGVDHVRNVHVGQAAQVRPDGSAQPLSGRVIAISTTPVSTTGSAAYRVTIELDGDTSALGNGSTATASITTATTKATLAVPTSAVTTNGDAHTVTVLDGTTTKQVDVQIGAIGPTWTAITSGLTDGQTVVLADLHTPLPSAATTATNPTNRNPFGNGGGLPPGGLPTGGFPGGGVRGN